MGGIGVSVAVGSGVLVAVGGTGVGVLVGGRVGIVVLVGGTAVAVGAGAGADVQPVTNVMIAITISDEDKQRTMMPSLANLNARFELANPVCHSSPCPLLMYLWL